MKVLHVIPSLSLSHGGPTHALCLMERSLTAQGVQVETVTTDDDGRGRRFQRARAVPLNENGVVRRYFAKWTEFYKVAPGLAWWAWRQVRHYDVVHIHALFSFSSAAAAWAARRAGVPYVLRPLGTLNHYGVTQRRPWLKALSLAWLEKPMLRHAAVVHFTAEAEWEQAKALGVPLRGVVIALGVEPPGPADPQAVRERWPGLADAPYALYLSRLDPKKNVEGLLRALALATPPGQAGPGFRLLLAGDGEPGYVASLKALAEQLGLTGQVVWAGHVDGALKASALAGATLFVLPSFSENFGIAAAEALAAGVPCLLGQGVAIAQEVADAGAGLAVAPEPERLAHALAHLMHTLTDPATRTAWSARASALAQARYSAQAMGARLARLYSGLTPP